MKQKILIIVSGADSQQESTLKQACDLLAKRTSEISNGEFERDFILYPSSKKFPLISGTGSSGYNYEATKIFYMDPEEIALEGRRIEIEKRQEFDIVCLAYDVSQFSDKFIVPVHTPIYREGFTVIENLLFKNGNLETLSNFLYHEICHADYYLARLNGSPYQDDVHRLSGMDDPRPEARFDTVLVKLKPYWRFLAQAEKIVQPPRPADPIKTPVPTPDLGLLLSLLQKLKAKLEEYIALKAAPKPRLTAWAEAIKEFELWKPPGVDPRYPKGTLSYQNKNPGNLKFAGQTGAIGKDAEGHAIFDTESNGWNALLRQLTLAATGKSSYYKPEMTLVEFFKKYAEKNGQQYAEFVAAKLNLPVTTQIKDLI